MPVEIAFLFIGFLTERTKSQLPLMHNGSSGWENRVGMTIYGKGTGFQAVGENVAENNLDSKRHVTVACISSRMQQTCVAARLSPGALWSVS